MDLSLSSQWYLSSQIVIEKSASASYSRSHTNGGQLECYRPLQFLRKRRVVLLVHYLCHQHPNWTGSFLVPMTCDLALALCVCRDIHIKIYIYTIYDIRCMYGPYGYQLPQKLINSLSPSQPIHFLDIERNHLGNRGDAPSSLVTIVSTESHPSETKVPTWNSDFPRKVIKIDNFYSHSH